jgi:hypothetical protein
MSFRRHLARGGNLDTYLRSISKDPLSYALSALILNRMIELCEGRQNSDELVVEFLLSQLWRALAANISVDSNIAVSLVLREKEAMGPGRSHKRAYAAVPVASGYGPIGAWQVIEGQAYGLEMAKVAALSGQRRIADSYESYLSVSGPRDYRIALEQFIARAESVASSDADLVMSFFCICDLALATPMHTVFYEIAQSLVWRDLHPGWRFVQICDAVKDVGTVGAETSSLDIAAYLNFVGRVCRRLSWPTPANLAEHFLKQQGVELLDNLPNVLFAAACAHRLENPTAFALYLFDEEARARRLTDSLPVPLIVGGGADDESYRLPHWRAVADEHRMAMAHDFLSTRDAYGLVDLLLYSTEDVASWNGFLTGSVDDLLQRHFGVGEADLSARAIRSVPDV